MKNVVLYEIYSVKSRVTNTYVHWLYVMFTYNKILSYSQTRIFQTWPMFFKKQKLPTLPFVSTWIQPLFLSMLIIFSVFCVVFWSFCLFLFYVLCCPMLPLSLDCPFLISLSVFSNVFFFIENIGSQIFNDFI